MYTCNLSSKKDKVAISRLYLNKGVICNTTNEIESSSNSKRIFHLNRRAGSHTDVKKFQIDVKHDINAEFSVLRIEHHNMFIGRLRMFIHLCEI